MNWPTSLYSCRRRATWKIFPFLIIYGKSLPFFAELLLSLGTTELGKVNNRKNSTKKSIIKAIIPAVGRVCSR
jgi:hypothetical protein